MQESGDSEIRHISLSSAAPKRRPPAYHSRSAAIVAATATSRIGQTGVCVSTASPEVTIITGYAGRGSPPWSRTTHRKTTHSP